MKVYIVMDEDGYNGNVVDRVFGNEKKAVAYVIESKFMGNAAYADMDQKTKEENALLFVEGFEVE